MSPHRLLSACGIALFLAAWLPGAWPPAMAQDYPAVLDNHRIELPRDHGSHPAFRTEWWYVTGWMSAGGGREMGVQITFFRNRPGIAEDSSSSFAPKQLLFAHAALADPEAGRLLHDQRSARAGFGIARAEQGRTDVRIDDWSLVLEGATYVARIAAREFDLELRFSATQGVLLQGHNGYSRKGPRAGQASYYYSRPQLALTGSVTLRPDSGTPRGGARKMQVEGRAWLDHEWSSQAMAEEAVGWDWIGINLDDGGALMAFRMRDAGGGVFWAGGTHRSAGGRVRVLRPAEVHFTPLRRWRSPRTGADYPVAMRVRIGQVQSAGMIIELEPVMEDQELDSRASTGTVYWEGAVRVRRGGKPVGRGYLELTGYWQPLKL